MKLAFSTLGCPDWSLKYAVEQAEKLGFQSIEIRGIRDNLRADTIEELLPDNREKSLRYAEEKGIVFCGLNSSASFHEKEKRKENTEETLATVKLASECNIPYVRIFGNNLITENEDTEIADIGSCVKLLCEEACKLNVGILLEVHGDFNTSARILKLAEAVNADNFGVIWDIQHSREDFKLFYENIRHLIRHVHIKDSINGNLCSTGEGSLPVAEIVCMLNKDGYDGYLSLEWEKRWHPELRSPEEEFPHYVKLMKQYLTD